MRRNDRLDIPSRPFAAPAAREHLRAIEFKVLTLFTFPYRPEVPVAQRRAAKGRLELPGRVMLML